MLKIDTEFCQDNVNLVPRCDARLTTSVSLTLQSLCPDIVPLFTKLKKSLPWSCYRNEEVFVEENDWSRQEIASRIGLLEHKMYRVSWALHWKRICIVKIWNEQTIACSTPSHFCFDGVEKLRGWWRERGEKWISLLKLLTMRRCFPTV